QVLVAVIAAAIFGSVAPRQATTVQPLATVFIDLIQITIAPIVFLVTVTGIVTTGGMKAVGRIAVKALIYFEIVSTVGMLLGLAAVNLLRPGVGVHRPEHASDQLSTYVPNAGRDTSFGAFLSKMVPDNLVGAFATGGVIQVLVVAVLFALAVASLPEPVSSPVIRGCTVLSEV
ncbi:cation:dicarboxylate symporter family transporter, partial [Nocardia gipuzkoensis]